MNKLVPKHYTYDIQDSSKVQEFMDCSRKYFYRYILGWVSDSPNNHLVFGTAWHLAMEHLLLNGYDDVNIVRAYDLFLNEYRKDFSEETDALFGAKTPSRVMECLLEYAHRYRNDKDEFEVLYTEIAGTVPLTEDRALHFRQDTICKGSEGYFSLEHKTRGSSLTRSWVQEWPLSVQVGTYTHVLYCLFPPEEVYGVKINGAGFLKTKFDLQRFPFAKTKRAMEVWMWTTLYWLDQIYLNFDIFGDATEDDKVMTVFPMNTRNCSKYFGCPYHDFCTAWSNPLSHIDEVPMGFKVEFWDPTKAETVKHKIEMGEMKP